MRSLSEMRSLYELRHLITVAVIAPIVLCAQPTEATASNHTPIGAVIDNVQLQTIAGSTIPVLASDGAATALLFFKPDQLNMIPTLNAIAGCEKELAGKPVRWVGVVPERYTAQQAKEAAAAAGIQMPVVIDKGDALHQVIGVAMHPTVAIMDKDHRLMQFQAFTKLNFCEAVMARIKRVLGELDDAGLARALDPSAEQPKGNVSAAKRDLKLAEMLLKGGNVDKALEIARNAARNDPSNPEVPKLIERILAAKATASK